MKRCCLGLAAGLLVATLSLGVASKASAQQVVYSVPSVPVVSYVPQRAGLFGLRTTYRPVVSYAPAAAAAPAPVTSSFYAPSTVVSGMPATTTYLPATPPVTTYYTPAAPAPAPVNVYYSPPVQIAPTTTLYPPQVLSRPVIIWP